MARNENGKGFSLKDHLFNREKVAYLAGLFAKVDEHFDESSFIKTVMTRLTSLPLKERIVWIAEVLETQLPSDFDTAAAVIIKALPPPLDSEKTDNDFGDFIFAPLGEYVVRNGLTRTHVHISLQTLEEITQRFSMEDAMRSFINTFPEEALQTLERWATHRHYHVRRLVSESTRPLLPWSVRVNLSHKRVIPLLDELYGDATRYVTRSVANHLNDIAKTDETLVIATLKRWQKEGRQDPDELQWMIAHSLRTLIKRGSVDALALLGYQLTPAIHISDFKFHLADGLVNVGGELHFSFTLKAEVTANLMVDYIVEFQKANGKKAHKVFKLKKLSVATGESYSLTKKHRFPKDATTIKYYPGTHTVTLQINGARYESYSFELLT